MEEELGIPAEMVFEDAVELIAILVDKYGGRVELTDEDLHNPPDEVQSFEDPVTGTWVIRTRRD